MCLCVCVCVHAAALRVAGGGGFRGIGGGFLESRLILLSSHCEEEAEALGGTRKEGGDNCNHEVSNGLY